MITRAKAALIAAVSVLLTVCLLLGVFVTEPDTLMTLIPHFHSPAYNGADVGYLQDSNNVADSVLSACNVERDGRYVRSRGRDRQTGDFYRVTDYSADGTCEINYTGINLDRHEIKEEGGDYTGFSWH